jgi:hypothetical protein
MASGAKSPPITSTPIFMVSRVGYTMSGSCLLFNGKLAPVKSAFRAYPVILN